MARRTQKIMLNETKDPIVRDKKGRFSKKLSYKAIMWLFALVGLLALLNEAVKFGATHYLQSPIKEVRSPIVTQKVINDREEPEWVNPVVQVVVEEQDQPINVENLTEVEKVIYEVFGPVDYKFARAMARGESGLEQERWNANTNKSLDIGLFQINSIHWDKRSKGFKPECSWDKVTTLRGNVECAKFLFDTQGPQIWTVVKNGNAARDYE